MTVMPEDKEIGPPMAVENAEELHEFKNAEGYVIDASDPEHANLKRARDGHTILLPQPSSDPNDPLNWSRFKKHLILIIISMTAFLPDYGSATGAVTLLPQSVVWNMTPDHVNHSQVGNVFMLGAGGVVVVALSAYVSCPQPPNLYLEDEISAPLGSFHWFYLSPSSSLLDAWMCRHNV